MSGFINVDSLVNNSFKGATKKFMSSLDSAIGKIDTLKPKYIYPNDIDKKSTANYMIIYIYDNKDNSTIFQPINTQIAKSKIQNDLAKRLTDCVSINLTDNAKAQLKQYKNAVLDYLKGSLKGVFDKDALSGLGSKLGIDIDTPEWIKEVGDFLTDNQLTRGIKGLLDNIDMPNLPGINSDMSLSDYVTVDVDGKGIQSILKEELAKEVTKIQNIRAEDISSLESEAGNNFRLVTSIVLPLPQNEITYSYKISIDSSDTKTAQAIADVIGGGVKGYEKARENDTRSTWVGKAFDRAGDVLAAFATGVKTASDIVVAQEGEIFYNMMGDGGKTLFQNKKGVVRDPLIAFSWNMPDPRTFTYEYTMAPRSSNELYDIWNIIKTLKFYSHMELGKDGHAVRYFNLPGRFKVKYYTEGNENVWLGKTKILGLTDIETTIDGNNMGFILNDFDKISGNPPKIIKLSMTFKEISILDRDDINEGY